MRVCVRVCVCVLRERKMRKRDREFTDRYECYEYIELER